MESKVYGYARVSTKEQNLDRQMIRLMEYGVEERNIITDKQSGKDFNRDGYRLLVSVLLRKGDTLVITTIDRLGRNKQEIKDELEMLRKMEVIVKILDIPTTLAEFPENSKWLQDMVTNVILEVVTSMAEQERLKILDRQEEGINAAIQKGKYLGRPRIRYPENWKEVYDSWKKGDISAKRAMELSDLKRTSFYKLIMLQEHHDESEELNYQYKAAMGLIKPEEEREASLLRKKKKSIE